MTLSISFLGLVLLQFSCVWVSVRILTNASKLKSARQFFVSSLVTIFLSVTTAMVAMLGTALAGGQFGGLIGIAVVIVGISIELVFDQKKLNCYEPNLGAKELGLRQF